MASAVSRIFGFLEFLEFGKPGLSVVWLLEVREAGA
jgi:hypothetical protein